jgi:hypothetical protein
VLSLLTADQQAQISDLASALLAELGAEPEAEAQLCRLCDLEACGRSSGRCPGAPARTRRAVLGSCVPGFNRPIEY